LSDKDIRTPEYSEELATFEFSSGSVDKSKSIKPRNSPDFFCLNSVQLYRSVVTVSPPWNFEKVTRLLASPNSLMSSSKSVP
jgi:hypothetical protein